MNASVQRTAGITGIGLANPSGARRDRPLLRVAWQHLAGWLMRADHFRSSLHIAASQKVVLRLPARLWVGGIQIVRRALLTIPLNIVAPFVGYGNKAAAMPPSALGLIGAMPGAAMPGLLTF
jgi:hypothetical protein